MAWLSGWSYRREITISGSSGAGTNYQVLLKIGESSGATGCHFHLDGKSASFPSGKNQGGDLRFTAGDGTTLLSFWVENVQGTSPNRVAYIWVRVSEDLETSKAIYCYFGNPVASNASNGMDTFLFFDDFDGTTLDTTKWQWVNYNGSYSVANSILTIYDTGNDGNQSEIRTLNYKPPANTAIETKAKGRSLLETAPYGDMHWVILADVNNLNVFNTSNQHFLFNNRDTDTIRHQSRSGGTWGTEDVVYSLYTQDTWRIGRVVLRASSQDYYILLEDRTVEGSLLNNTDAPQNFAGTYYLGMGGRNGYIDFDWTFVRKYVSPEPAFSFAGSVEKVLISSRRLLLMPL